MIERLGQRPSTLPAVFYDKSARPIARQAVERRAPEKKELVGIDVLAHSDASADQIANKLKAAGKGLADLVMITNRGVKVWPEGLPETFCTDHWHCRFMVKPGRQFHKAMIVDLLRNLVHTGADFVNTTQLFTFDGEARFSLGQVQ